MSMTIIPSPSTSTLRFGYNCCTRPKPNHLSSCFAPSRRCLFMHRRHRQVRVRAVSANLGSIPDPLASSSNNRYHPSEDIISSVPKEGGDDVRLTDAETARTLVEVNSKATVMFSGLSEEEIQENIIWPDLPYLTDEHGDIYFEVSNNEDILQNLIADDKIVQVIIGLDNLEMLEDLEISGPSGFDFGLEEMESEDSDIDDDSDEDEFIVIEDDGEEDDDDDMITSETSSDWTNLETMQSSHPIYFAKKISQVVSDINLDWMDLPSASIVVQGALRPAFVEEHSFIKKHLAAGGTKNNEAHPVVEVAEDNLKDELDKDQSLQSGTSFYKLEYIKIQLVSSYGTQVQDFREARPDDVVHHSAKIISQMEAAGDETVQALKSLCWRLKNIQVEEAAITGVDSLGFDLRVCSGTQVQTLRFAFRTRATSEFHAERQLHDLLFPMFQHKHQS